MPEDGNTKCTLRITGPVLLVDLDLDPQKVQVVVDRITQAYWAAGLPGFPGKII